MDNHEPSNASNNNITRERYSQMIDEKKLVFYKVINLLVMNRHDADEIFQESMLIGWEKRSQLREEGRFVPWMIRIIRSVITKRFRIQQRDRGIWKFLFRTEQEASPMRTLKHNPEENMLKDEEKTVAMDAYERLPDLERVIYGLYHSESFSQATIAEMLDMPEGTVRNHLHRAQRRLNKQMHSMTIAFLVDRLHEGDPSALVQQVVEKIYAMPLTAEAGVATTGVAAGAAQTGFSFSGFLQVVALPFLWITSLFISGTASGIAFVRNMPTLQARRWLVKHLAFCYMGMVILPLAFVMLDWIIRNYLVGFHWTAPVFAVFFCLGCITACVYVFRLNREYQKVLLDNKTHYSSDEGIEYARFAKIVKMVLWVVFGFICLFWGCFFGFEIMSNIVHAGLDWFDRKQNFLASIALIVLAVISMGFHFGISSLFRYFIEISKDKTTFEASQLPKTSSPASENSSLFREIVFILPFLVYFLGANVMHLAVTRTRIISSSVELVFYSALWLFVLFQNTRHQNSRWKNIWTMFLIQFLIFQVLRYVFYD